MCQTQGKQVWSRTALQRKTSQLSARKQVKKTDNFRIITQPSDQTLACNSCIVLHFIVYSTCVKTSRIINKSVSIHRLILKL